MRVHTSLLVLLIGLLPVRAAHGQQSVSSSLAEAERTFINALASHDRAAFTAMFADDAESTLPSVTHGPEAIANMWLPFLIDPGTTMILATTSVATAPAGDTGTSSGTFAIRGRTNNGVQTIPAGTYSITWRLVEGHWKIARLSGGSGKGASAPASRSESISETVDRGGVGPFRFGMTRDEVSRVRDCAPYVPVTVTGGLECAHYRFDDREMNISFIFAGERLRRIQLWYYEGESSVEARDAIVTFLQRTTGGATLSARPDVPLSGEGIVAALNNAGAPVGRQIVQLDITAPSDGSIVWFSRVGRHEHGYLVMLFAEAAAR
jgi:ketosteroid isomerase-like protein